MFVGKTLNNVAWSINEAGEFSIDSNESDVSEFDFSEVTETVLVISKSCFSSFPNIVSIVIPESVRIIDDAAFQDCKNLTTVSFRENSCLECIGDSAFKNSGLQHFDVPKTVKKIGSCAFQNSSLTSINIDIASSLESIGSYAFGSTKIEKITIPDNVSAIGPGVFVNTAGSLNCLYVSKNFQNWSILNNQNIRPAPITVYTYGENNNDRTGCTYNVVNTESSLNVLTAEAPAPVEVPVEAPAPVEVPVEAPAEVPTETNVIAFPVKPMDKIARKAFELEQKRNALMAAKKAAVERRAATIAKKQAAKKK